MTATIHMKFHYKDRQVKGVVKEDVEMINDILDRASDMSSDERAFLVRFADYLKGESQAGHGS